MREEQTLGHDAHHHELPEKQDPSIPRFHHHTPNQSFFPPSIYTHRKLKHTMLIILNVVKNELFFDMT